MIPPWEAALDDEWRTWLTDGHDFASSWPTVCPDSPSPPAPMLLLTAGIGVTPVMAMLHALADVRSPRPVWWVHAARSGREHAFRDRPRTFWPGCPKPAGSSGARSVG